MEVHMRFMERQQSREHIGVVPSRQAEAGTAVQETTSASISDATFLPHCIVTFPAVNSNPLSTDFVKQ